MDPKYEMPTTDNIRSLRASLANIAEDERAQIEKLFKCKEPFARSFQQWQSSDDFIAFAHPDRIVTMNALCELGGFSFGGTITHKIHLSRLTLFTSPNSGDLIG